MRRAHIKLNEPGALSIESVRRLLASHDDQTHSQIRVNKDGIAFLSTEHYGNSGLEDIKFRIETFQAGNGCTGEDAASDDAWVRLVYNALHLNWPTPSARYLEIF
ncbi:hypothetical protein LJR232_005020 [Aquipseudomonas alcaligenes]